MWPEMSRDIRFPSLHKEAQHLASQLELVVAGEAVSGDVQVSQLVQLDDDPDVII